MSRDQPQCRETLSSGPLSMRIPSWLLALAVVIGLYLLFVGRVQQGSSRVFETVWDLGHIPFMFVFGLGVLRLLTQATQRYRAGAVSGILPSYIALILSFSAATEFVQSFVGRTASLSDILANCLGAALALLAANRSTSYLSTKNRRYLIVGALAISIGLLLKPAAIFYDSWLARAQFPLLAGFESPTETLRWRGYSDHSRSTEQVTEGQHSLKIQLHPKGYSYVSFQHFPADWRGYRSLRFNVWSPRTGLPITLRIHDQAHQQGHQDYSDRFNRRYLLKRGWNQIVIDLNDVAQAPATRVLELGKVQRLSWFSANLGRRETIYLDQLILAK